MLRRRRAGERLRLALAPALVLIAVVAGTAPAMAGAGARSEPPPAARERVPAPPESAGAAARPGEGDPVGEVEMTVILDPFQDSPAQCRVEPVGDGACPPEAAWLPARLREAPAPLRRPLPVGATRSSAEVVMVVGVDPGGDLTDVAIESSSRDRALDRTAMDHVRRLRFEPATEDGRRVHSRLRVAVGFESVAPAH